MGKKNYPVSCDYTPPPYTAEEQKSDFKKSYEFSKPAPVRSPVKGWEHNYIKQGDRVPTQEKRLVNGSPSFFKGIRTGNSYGNRQAIRRTNRKG